MGPSGITFEEFKRLELLAANQIHAVMSVREGHDSHVKEFVMSKRTNHIPPALKHGIYSGFGLLPTEDQAEFQKFKQEIFDEYVPVVDPNGISLRIWPVRCGAGKTYSRIA
jgi:hypothetical protein